MRFLLQTTFIIILFPFLTSTAAYSGMIEVRPTMLIITPAQHVAVLALANPEEQPSVYQVRIYRWHQKEAEQILEPCDDIIASPPMVSLAAKGSQLVRIGLRGAALPMEEQSYRLILEEIPPPVSSAQPGLNISLRLSLPLFVRNINGALPPEQLTADTRLSGNEVLVAVHNNGHFTTRIAHAAFSSPDLDASRKIENTSLIYIQPGGQFTYHFTLPNMPASFRGAVINVQTDQDAIDLAAPLISGVPADVSPPPPR